MNIHAPDNMNSVRNALLTITAGFVLACAPASATAENSQQEPTLYAVGYAHLDTEWRWDFVMTIDEFIKNTLDENFALFEKYPDYVFSFTGSARYAMMREYYPDKYEKLKEYIAAGRWFVSGSSVDEGDVLVPSPESVIRQVLYGNQYFRSEFGKESVDFMLPDCFGFPASLPSIWAHCGLLGFSTQKLTWGSAIGIPFNIGVWEGPDGKSVVAALNPGNYVGSIRDARPDRNIEWAKRIEENGLRYGVHADYHYYGVGDRGGAPREADVQRYTATLREPDGYYRIRLASSDQFFKDLDAEQVARLPRYKGDMLLTEHSSGSISSQAYMKRWNRKNEILADAAERAAVTADWLKAARYPIENINKAWELVLLNQMHDILPGTSIPKAYEYAWNNDVIALNTFAGVLTGSIGAIARHLDTQTEGIPLVVYNQLATAREDVVAVEIDMGADAPAAVRVFAPCGMEVPAQVTGRKGSLLQVLFLARVEPMSWSVFEVRPAATAQAGDTGLTVTGHVLENAYYRVTIDEAGDVSGIFDKQAGREVLAGPHRLEINFHKPKSYPAWNMDWEDKKLPPLGHVDGPAVIEIVENGPVRVAIRVKRTARNSVFEQDIRLSAGTAGQRVEFANYIDWRSLSACLKATFPLAVANPEATYNWGLGTIARGNNSPTKYEVPSHEWFDLTDLRGDYGVSILEDSKFGSDKPDDNTLRLTLLYTPGVRMRFKDQRTQDWGRHDILYALYGHRGDHRQGLSEWQARRLNAPLTAFQVPKHACAGLGRAFSLVSINTPQVDLRALKKAENGDHTIIRLQELMGSDADTVIVDFATDLIEAWEVDGQERRTGDALLVGGNLVFAMGKYSPRSFALRFADAGLASSPPTVTPLQISFNADVVSGDHDRADGSMQDGLSYPAEMFPGSLQVDGIVLHLGPTTDATANALSCAGQTIRLPSGAGDRLYLLAAADTDVHASLQIGEQTIPWSVQQWTGYIGQWDNRLWDPEPKPIDYVVDSRMVGIADGYIKRDPVAWFASHRHTPDKNDTYQFSYIYKYAFDIPRGADRVVLPANPAIKVFAAAVVANTNDRANPAQPLYDDLSRRDPIDERIAHVRGEPLPMGEDAVERRSSYEQLRAGPPSASDYADQHAGNGVTFRAVTAPGLATPHVESAVTDGLLIRLNDGQGSDPATGLENGAWFVNGEGRILVDLKRAVWLDRLHVYSRHPERRLQNFSWYGSDHASLPDPAAVEPLADGWSYIRHLDTSGSGDHADIHVSSVTAADTPLGPFRWLLMICDPEDEGTVFTEIDIFTVAQP